MTKEDSKLAMIRNLFESMKNSVENCDHKTVLNTTSNLSANLDRAFISSGNSELQRKLMDIDNETSKLKDIFATKCSCVKK